MSEVAGLLGPGTWVQQGPATLIVREAGWVVLVPGTRKEVVEAAWTVLGEAPAAEDFLDRLVAAAELESADKLAAILYGIADGSSVGIGVKGRTPVAVYTADGAELIAGTDEDPYVLRTVEGVLRTAFGDLPAEESLGAPRIESGITRVRGFVHMSVDPAELEDDARRALADLVETDGRSIEDPEAKTKRAANPPPSRPAPAPSAAAPMRRPAVAERKSGEMPPSISRGGSSSATSRPAEPAPTGPSVFDGLFSDPTTAPAAGPASPPAAEPAAAAPGTSGPQSPASSQPPPPAAVPSPAAAPSAEPAPFPDPAADSAAAAPAVAASTESPATSRSGEGRSQKPSAGRRRLVSTSLFDRKSGASGGAARPVAPSAPPAPSGPRGPAALPSSPPHASVPTPEPPHEDDAADEDDGAPVTLVAPIDDGEGPEQEDPADPPGAPPAAHRSMPLEVPAARSSAHEAEPTGSYDDLFGKTVFRRIEDAAVRRTEQDEEHDEEPQEPAPAVSTPSTASAPEQEGEAESGALSTPVSSTEASASIGGEFIDWVPGVGRAAPEVAHTAARRAAEVPAPDPAYPQVHMAEQPAPHPGPAPHAGAPDPAPSGSSPAAPPRPADGGPHGGGPTPGPGHPTGGAVALPGLVCANGHANSPERSECRACRAPLQGRTRTVARPPLGTVAITTGGGFVLDRTAIVGRRPRASRVSAHDVPQLITVPSPQQDISRSHVELRLEGWHVVALDLGTTNGTTLHRPGMEAVRLRPREGVVLYDGDQLDLGDGVTLQLREAV